MKPLNWRVQGGRIKGTFSTLKTSFDVIWMILVG